MAAQPLGSYQEVPTSCCPVLIEIDRHDPETGNSKCVLGVYSRLGWCFRLRSRIGVHFRSRPDISIAGNYRTFLLRFDTGFSKDAGAVALSQTRLESSSDADAQVCYRLPTHMAVREGYAQIVKLLLDQGADTDK